MAAVLVLCPVVVFAIVMRWPPVFYVSIPILLISVWTNKGIRFSAIKWFASAVGMAVAIQAYTSIFPLQESPYSMVPPETYFPPLLGACLSAAFFEHRKMSISLLILASYTGLMVAGGVALQAVNENLFYYACTGVTGLYMVVLVLFLAGTKRIEPCYQRGSSESYAGAKFITGTGMLVMSVFLVMLWVQVIFSFYDFMNTQSIRFLQSFARISRGASDLNLREMVPEDFQEQDEILIRVASDHAPGYMRSRIYECYYKGRWVSRSATELLPSQPVPGCVEEMRRFTIKQSNESAQNMHETISLHTQFVGAFKNPVLIVPGNAEKVDLLSDSLKLSAEGLLVPASDAKHASIGYTTHIRKGTYDAAYQGPRDMTNLRETYLAIQDSLKPGIQHIANEVFSNNADEQSSRETMTQLSWWLSRNTSYALGVKFSGDQDPVIKFLTETRRAHCSLFAAATVLLLRTQNIPARVVSGFICSEKHPNGGYWVARANTAHAWAEAYIEEENRWILVENTPASGVPQGESQYNAIDSLFDLIAFYWQSLVTAVKSGRLENVLMILRQSLTGLILHPVILVLLTALLAGTAMRWTISIMKRKKQATSLDETTRTLRRCLHTIEKQLKRYGVRRKPAWTLAEWCAALQALPVSDKAVVWIELLEEYEHLRYSDDTPSIDALNNFKARLG